MVTRKNVGFWQHGPVPPPGASDAARAIPGGPVYPPSQVQRILEGGEESIVLWTEDCNSDVSVKLGWDTGDVASLLACALRYGVFKGTVWCDQKPHGPVAACDSYVVRNREWNEAAKKDLLVEYYIKFAISKTGTHLLVVSCHV